MVSRKKIAEKADKYHDFAIDFNQENADFCSVKLFNIK